MSFSPVVMRSVGELGMSKWAALSLDALTPVRVIVPPRGVGDGDAARHVGDREVRVRRNRRFQHAQVDDVVVDVEVRDCVVARVLDEQERVLAVPARERVVARAPEDGVVAFTAGDRVVAGVAEQQVVACIAVDGVVAAVATDDIAVCAAVDGVVAAAVADDVIVAGIAENDVAAPKPLMVSLPSEPRRSSSPSVGVDVYS